jgi:hypothetical protein
MERQYSATRAARHIVLAGVCTLALAGCAAPQPVAQTNPNYAPYDIETNPFCGALGNCRPLITEPYAMRGGSF